MNNPDLNKIRRFSLASGIILITYYAALVEFSSPVALTMFGINFKVLKPNYISIGLILTSFLSTLRFTLYGLLIERPPYLIQRRLTQNKCVYEHEHNLGDEEDIYEFEIKCYSEEDLKMYMDELNYVFPHIDHGKKGIRADTFQKSEGKSMKIGYIHFNITPKTKILSYLLNIDYTAPVWLNIIALFIAFYKFH